MAAIRACRVGTTTYGGGDQSSFCQSVGRASSNVHASTSAILAPLARKWQLQFRRGLTRGTFVLAARRGGDWDDDKEQGKGSRKRSGSKGGGFQFSNSRGTYRVQYNEYEAEVRQDEAWKLIVPLLGGLVLTAGIIGPIIIGIAFSAVAVGAALSAGAIFTSLFLPFFILIGAGALFFGGVTFSAFATLGTALLLPKLISLAVVGGGLGLGFLTVSLFLKPAADKAKESYKEADGRSSGSDSGKRQPRGGEEPELIVEAEDVDPEMERQLREFDDLLAGRDEQRRKADRWRAGGGSR